LSRKSLSAGVIASALILAGIGMAPVPAAVAATNGTQAAVLNGWGPVVAGDEFNYTGAPDPAKWGVYNSLGHNGQGIRSPQAWSVANGVATVNGDSSGTTGGMLAKFAAQKYGRWEVRMRANAGEPKYHPVVALWPNNSASPNCAEVDFAENTGDTNLMHFYLHYACDRTQSFQTRASAPVDPTQWHNYAVEWTPSGITGYLDGVEWFTDTVPAHNPSVAMHQTLQLDWFPDGTATKPSWMQVDWVRVYALDGGSAPAVSPFSDVSTTQQFYMEMAWLDEKGISTGWVEADGTCTYRALQSVSRDAMAAFLYRLAGSPAYKPPAVSPFTDVSTSQQFYKEIAWLAAKHISGGWVAADGSRTYRPLQPISRDAMAAYLYRLAGSPVYTAPTTSPFRDLSTSQAFYKEMAWLADNGISTGWVEADGTHTYRALQSIRRDAMAAFLFRYDATNLQAG